MGTHQAIIDGREYTGSGALDIAVQRYGEGVGVWADPGVDGLFTVIDDDGQTIVARIHVGRI